MFAVATVDMMLQTLQYLQLPSQLLTHEAVSQQVFMEKEYKDWNGLG